jgi:hypothetical protein
MDCRSALRIGFRLAQNFPGHRGDVTLNSFGHNKESSSNVSSIATVPLLRSDLPDVRRMTFRRIYKN